MTEKMIEEIIGDVTDSEANELERQLQEDELTQEEQEDNDDVS